LEEQKRLRQEKFKPGVPPVPIASMTTTTSGSNVTNAEAPKVVRPKRLPKAGRGAGRGGAAQQPASGVVDTTSSTTDGAGGDIDATANAAFEEVTQEEMVEGDAEE
jgi:hypothetical protein